MTLVRRRVGPKGASCVVAAVALLWLAGARAETEIYLLRGWFNVFSTGMDTLAEELRDRGIRAEAMGHLSWRSAVAKIVDERASGRTGRLVLVGHSQGANNAIDMARELEKHDIPVDLLITLVPFMQNPVPANVLRAINYYQSPGWGSPLTADPGFTGAISNVNIAGDWEILHITIDKSAKVQAAVVEAIAALPP